MKKMFSCGKIDAYGIGCKNCEVEVEIELKENSERKPIFSANAKVWNNTHSATLISGQCFDTLYEEAEELRNNETFITIYQLWQRNNLNDMNAGTPAQEELVRKYNRKFNNYDYDSVCKYLKDHNLLIDNGYKYGSAWLYREISEEDLKMINKLLED